MLGLAKCFFCFFFSLEGKGEQPVAVTPWGTISIKETLAHEGCRPRGTLPSLPLSYDKA